MYPHFNMVGTIIKYFFICLTEDVIEFMTIYSLNGKEKYIKKKIDRIQMF